MAQKPATVALLALGRWMCHYLLCVPTYTRPTLDHSKRDPAGRVDRAGRTGKKEVISRRQRLGLRADHRRDSSLV